MIKDLIKYILLSGLLYGGHYFLAETFPERGLLKYRDVSQLLLLILFVKSHVLTQVLSKKFKLLPGQVFLGFSVVKLIIAGLFIFYLKKTNTSPISKSFTLVFMGSYFAYLSIDVLSMLKIVKEEKEAV